jgi:hypothetical protein
MDSRRDKLRRAVRQRVREAPEKTEASRITARSLESGRDQPHCKGDRGRKLIAAV